MAYDLMGSVDDFWIEGESFPTTEDVTIMTNVPDTINGGSDFWQIFEDANLQDFIVSRLAAQTDLPQQYCTLIINPFAGYPSGYANMLSTDTEVAANQPYLLITYSTEAPAKTLTADITDKNVDCDLEITFAADAAFEDAVTGVTFAGNSLTANQYTVSSGKLILHPSSADNNYLRTPGSGNVVIEALIQDITAPVANGGQFAQQPVVAVKDQYGNTCTSDNSTEVTVSKKDSGTWSLTGTVTVPAVNGVITFTGLVATNEAEVTNAQLAFNSGELTQVTGAMVTLPAANSGSGGGGRNSGGNTTPTTPTQPTETGVEILVNGKTETAATATTTQAGEQTVTTVIVDDKKVAEKPAGIYYRKSDFLFP